MTVSSNDRRAGPFTGGSNHPFDFKVFEAGDLLVVRTNADGSTTDLVLDSDYTVSLNADQDNNPGGTIAYAVAGGTSITVIGDLDYSQGTDITNGGGFYPQVIENALDRLVMLIQQLGEKVNRSFLLPVGSTLSNLVFPSPEAGRALRWNNLGTALENFTITLTGSVVSANEITEGIAEIATTAETTAGAADDKIITPLKLAQRLAAVVVAATESIAGIAKVATQAIANAGANDTDFITARKLWTVPMRGGWKNILGDNGGLEIWQRGAGGSASIAVPAATTAYTADRWYLQTGANQASVVSQQAGLNVNSGSCARAQRNAGQTGVGAMYFAYPLDTDEVRRLRGKKPTLRMQVRGGSNWSPASGALSVVLFTGTGAGAAKRGGGVAYTGEALSIDAVVNLTADGVTVVEFNGTGGACGANITQGELRLAWTPVGTAGANDYFEIDDVDLRADEPVIDQFERRPFFDCLDACQVHFWKTFDYGTAPAQNAGAPDTISWPSIVGASLATRSPQINCPRQMRGTPTVTTYNPSAANAQARNITDGADCSATGAITYGQGRSIAITTTTSAGTAANEVLAVHVTCDAGI